MRSYWVTFSEFPAGCVEADDEAKASEIAKQITGAEVLTVQDLPYPAHPKLNGDSMAFCHSPAQCCGKTACPQRLSCVD